MLPLAKADGIVWAALLTPQGKYLADFFIVAQDGRLLLYIKDSLAAVSYTHLDVYKRQGMNCCLQYTCKMPNTNQQCSRVCQYSFVELSNQEKTRKNHFFF